MLNQESNKEIFGIFDRKITSRFLVKPCLSHLRNMLRRIKKGRSAYLHFDGKQHSEIRDE